MTVKYKIHEIAKSFGVPSKTIVDMLKGLGGDRKYSTMTSIEGLELDIVFDKLTKDAAVDSFDSLLASAKPMKRKKSDDQPKVQVFVSEGVDKETLEAQAQEASEPKKNNTKKDKGEAKEADAPAEDDFVDADSYSNNE